MESTSKFQDATAASQRLFDQLLSHEQTGTCRPKPDARRSPLRSQLLTSRASRRRVAPVIILCPDQNRYTGGPACCREGFRFRPARRWGIACYRPAAESLRTSSRRSRGGTPRPTTFIPSERSVPAASNGLLVREVRRAAMLRWTASSQLIKLVSF
jgi:hypothetical protein